MLLLLLTILTYFLSVIAEEYRQLIILCHAWETQLPEERGLQISFLLANSLLWLQSQLVIRQNEVDVLRSGCYVGIALEYRQDTCFGQKETVVKQGVLLSQLVLLTRLLLVRHKT